MKRMLILLLCTAFLLAGCAGDGVQAGKSKCTAPSPSSSAAGTPFAQAGDTHMGSAASEPPVQSDDKSIEITLPAGFLDMNSDLENDLKGVDVIKNTDGSVTYRISKEEQKELLANIGSSCKKAFEDISDTFPNIVKVEHNADFTEFTVVTKNGKSNVIINGLIKLYGKCYQVFSGKPIGTDIKINVK